LRVLDVPAAEERQRALLVHGHEEVCDAFQVRVWVRVRARVHARARVRAHVRVRVHVRVGVWVRGRAAFQVGASPGSRRAAVRAGAHERVVHQAAAAEVHEARGKAAGGGRCRARIAAAGGAALLRRERGRVLLRLAERDCLALAHHLIEGWRLVRAHLVPSARLLCRSVRETAPRDPCK
jgi:hypothetical protein